MPATMAAVDAAWVRKARRRLLAWYDAHARELAWRIGPAARAAGARADPYRVWLSEVMLQQTTTPHATPYFLRFVERWPTVTALADADDGAMMGAWAGLGYYARARNLLACARAVRDRHGGGFPDTEAGLRALPGIGAYTAAAVASIAFDRAANVVDGNVERVMARLFAVETPLPAAKPELARLAGALVEDDRPGDWAQALMDLGATVCRPKAPLCSMCPLAELCAARQTSEPQVYPLRTPRAERPRRYGVAYVVRSGDGVAVIRRPASGLLGGMLGLPTTEWRAQSWSLGEARESAPNVGPWRDAGVVEHVFTHFSLTLRILMTDAGSWPAGAVPLRDPADLPSAFRKAVAKALAAGPDAADDG